MKKKDLPKLLKDIPKYRHFGPRRYPIPEKERLRMYLDQQPGPISPSPDKPSKVSRTVTTGHAASR